MAIDFVCNKNKSFRSNVRKTLPLLAESFFSQVGEAAHHPKSVKEMHEIRLSGKPLRYLMELCEPYFGKEFSNCYREIKDFIALIGDIHDSGLMLQSLSLYKRELEIFNKTIGQTDNRIQTVPLVPIMRTLREHKTKCMSEFTSIAKRWQLTGFKKKLTVSLYE